MSWQGLACLKLVASIFCLSAVAKAWRPTSMEAVLMRLGLTSQAWLEGFVLVLIFIEASLGMTLWMGKDLKNLIIFTLLLLLVMVLSLLRLHLKGFRDKCSCYGQWLQLSPLEALKLDLVYMGMLVFALSELPASDLELKSNPIWPMLIALGLMGLGKLRFKNESKLKVE